MEKLIANNHSKIGKIAMFLLVISISAMILLAVAGALVDISDAEAYTFFHSAIIINVVVFIFALTGSIVYLVKDKNCGTVAL